MNVKLWHVRECMNEYKRETKQIDKIHTSTYISTYKQYNKIVSRYFVIYINVLQV